jgi:hypothetical protein
MPPMIGLTDPATLDTAPALLMKTSSKRIRFPTFNQPGWNAFLDDLAERGECIRRSELPELTCLAYNDSHWTYGLGTDYQVSWLGI